MATGDDWRQQIRKKLMELYGHAQEDMTSFLTLLAFFNKEAEKELYDQYYLSPFNQTLKMALELNNELVFKEYADRMKNDAVEVLKNPKFYAEMERIYQKFAEPNSDQDWESTFLLVDNLDESTCNESGALGLFAGLKGVLQNIPKEEVRQLLEALQTVVKTFATDYRALSCVDEFVSVFNKVGGTMVMVGLAAVFLTWECYKNMKRWWRKEISGKRCAKNCIDSLSQIGAGMVGGVAGAAVGTMVCPIVGTCIGGIVGGLLSGYAAKVFSDAITRNIFDLPKEEALEKAFNYLGVHHTASNNEINKNFHRLCLKHHPDKGGNAADFHLLQHHMTTIKISRGE
ncbi:unnamed protein product [Orchesella dallaii]|uniref:J domain-containing protein n=1 Tax=Orchesella dallaii TaxID=48710 RepID=A0ABP1QVL1_9HEXA